MSKLFKRKKKPYNLRSQKKLYGSSTPKSKVDACVECDLPFDESEIAPELRRVRSPGEEEISGLREARPYIADRVNETNLEPIDISVESSHKESTSLSEPPADFQKAQCTREEVCAEIEEQDTPDPDEFCTKEPIEKGREKEKEKEKSTGENNLTAGGRQVPVINSPADIYKHFPVRPNYEESLKEDPNESHSDSSDNSDFEDYFSHSGVRQSPLFTSDKEELHTRENLATGTMQAEVLEQLREQVDFLQQELRSQQQNHREFRQRTINAMEQAPIPDTSSSQRPAPFHGFDSEDINRWIDKVEHYLNLRRIQTDSPTALAELILNLAGPAEDFYYSLDEERKNTFVALCEALRERFSNENQNWIIWQAITTRQQGPVESIDTYLNDLTSKFRRIKISDADKMRHFVQGLRADLRETVLLKQPKSFQEAEEMARLAAAVKTTMNNSNQTMAAQLNNLTKTLNTMVAGTSSSVNDQQQAMRVQMETLTKKIDSLLPTQAKPDKVAAYSEPRKDDQIKELQKLIQELTNEMKSLDRRVDARINGIVQRERDTRRDTRANPQRSRDGRPFCFFCGQTGHIQISCPQRRSREQGPVPRHALPPPGNMERNCYQPGFQPRYGALGPPGRQDRLAALNYDYYDLPEDYMAPMGYYDITGSGHDDYPGEWDDYYEYEPEEEYYDLKEEWNPVHQKRGSYVPFTDNLSPTAIPANGTGSVDKLASNPETLKQTSREQTTDGEEIADNSDELVNDISTPQGTPSGKQDPSPAATLETNTIIDQFADADETEEVISNDQPVQSAVGKTFPFKEEATDQYREPDTVLTEDTGDIPLPPSTANPDAFRDADDTRDDPKAGLKAEPNQLNDGAAYTSPVSEASGEPADKSKVESGTVTIEKSAYPVDSTTEQTTSSATAKEHVAAKTSEPIVQDPRIKQRPARTKNVASTSTKERQSDLTVEVQINGKTTRCLVDTGAAVSVLDADHMLELYDGQPPPLKPSESRLLKTVSGENLPVRGILCTSISIAGGNYPCEFKVLEGVTYKGVLGRDFLRATRANISFEKYTLQLKDKAPVTFSEDLLVLIAPVTYVIPPRSETVIPAKIKGEVPPGAIGLIESVPRLAERYHLQGAAALVKVTEGETVPFRLINPTSKPITLYKGASLGTFSEADGDPDFCPVGENSHTQPPQKEPGEVPVDLQSSSLNQEQQGRLRVLLNEYREYPYIMLFQMFLLNFSIT